MCAQDASIVYDLSLVCVTLLREADSCCLGQQHTVHVSLPHNGLCHLYLLTALLFQRLQFNLGFLQTLLQLTTPVIVHTD